MGVTGDGLVLLDPVELREVEQHPPAQVGVVGPEPDLYGLAVAALEADRRPRAGVQLEVPRSEDRWQSVRHLTAREVDKADR